MSESLQKIRNAPDYIKFVYLLEYKCHVQDVHDKCHFNVSFIDAFEPQMHVC